MQLSLRQLEVFLSIAECGSFSEAAKTLHVSQPALTRTIQQTEGALGARLFDRSTRKVELTIVGADILPIAQRILGEFKSACIQMSQSVERLNGRLTVAAPPSIAGTLLPPVIAFFVKNHPEVEIQMLEVRSANIADAVAEGSCDFAISSKPPAISTISYQELFGENMYMICKADDLMASSEPVPWSIFAARPFISMARGCSTRTIAEEAFASLNLDVKPLYECEHLATMRSLIAAGLGIGAISRSMFHEVGSENVVARLLIEPTLIRSVGIITHSERMLSTTAQEFLKTIIVKAPRIGKELTQPPMVNSGESARPSHNRQRTSASAQLRRVRAISRQ